MVNTLSDHRSTYIANGLFEIPNQVRHLRQAALAVGVPEDGRGVNLAKIRGGPEKIRPRLAISRRLEPSSDCAAVAPNATTNRGLMTAISLSSHGLQARTSIVNRM
jgi:hypothetical protein